MLQLDLKDDQGLKKSHGERELRICMPLTIMFSKAHLASQQLRNTGMKMSFIEGQKI